MKIIWNQNKWLAERHAGYRIVGWGQVFPTTEARLERELREHRESMAHFLKEIRGS